jgi:hypothetical protein
MFCGAERETSRHATAPNRVTKRLRAERDRCAAGDSPGSCIASPPADDRRAHAMTLRDVAT